MVKAIVLAAGKGTRLQSEQYQIPKVLRKACGRPLLAYVLDGLSFLPKEDVILVVGYMKDAVTAAFPQYPFAVQEPQLGTGHAVSCAKDLIEDFDGTVLVCYGDMPLIPQAVYQDLIQCHQQQKNQCTLLSSICEDDLPYGRIIRDENGGFLEVVEDRDCTPEQKTIRELNVGIYAFSAKALISALAQLSPNNAQNEFYLTDVPALILKGGGKAGVYASSLGEEIIGVNTAEQLERVEQLIKNKN